MLKQRVITALCLAPPLIASIFFMPSRLFACLMGVVSLLACHEWIKLCRPRITVPITVITLVVVALLIAVVVWVGDQPWWSTIDFIIVAIGVLLWIGLVARLADTTNTASASIPAEGISIGVTSVVVALVALVAIHRTGLIGPVLVFCFMLTVAAADIGAYFTGRRFGRVKLAPELSPGKTREGVAGGMGSAALVCAGVFLFAQFPSQHALLNVFYGLVAGCLTAAISVVGDLYASLGKRRAEVKDSGRLLPGHGGILDRIDGMLAAAPMFAAIVFVLS